MIRVCDKVDGFVQIDGSSDCSRQQILSAPAEFDRQRQITRQRHSHYRVTHPTHIQDMSSTKSLCAMLLTHLHSYNIGLNSTEAAAVLQWGGVELLPLPLSQFAA
jgi:hypothetical protein